MEGRMESPEKKKKRKEKKRNKTTIQPSITTSRHIP